MLARRRRCRSAPGWSSPRRRRYSRSHRAGVAVAVAAEGAEAVNQKQSEKPPRALSKQVLKHNTHCNTQLAHTKEPQSARAHAKNNKLTAWELPRLRNNMYRKCYGAQRAHRGSGRRRRRRHHHARLVGAVSVLRPLDQTQRTKTKGSTTREKESESVAQSRVGACALTRGREATQWRKQPQASTRASER